MSIAGDSLSSFPILLIVAGGIALLLAFLSCCGAIKGNTCMLFFVGHFHFSFFRFYFKWTFFIDSAQFSIVLMGVVVYIEIGTAAAIYSKKNQIEDIVDYGLNKTLYKSNANKDYYDTWHLLQSEVRKPSHFMHGIIQFLFCLSFEKILWNSSKEKQTIFEEKNGFRVFFQLKCCGIDGPSDWKNVFANLPPSCCLKPIDDTTCTEEHESVSKTGCKPIFFDFLMNNLYMMAGIGLGAAAFQVISNFLINWHNFHLKFSIRHFAP